LSDITHENDGKHAQASMQYMDAHCYPLYRWKQWAM